ncbi:MAG: pilus assembly protein, partial [Chloroflexota bacterium]
MINLIRSLKWREVRGQSLVETALFLPILVFMLAGIVEVSNLLITQNRVTTSSRMAAGYGAANFDRDNWASAGGTAEDMGIVALNTISESMPLNTDLWDIYSAHGLTNQEGTDFDVFESEWVYGAHNVVTAAEWTAMEATIKAEILDALQAECPDDPASCAGNIEFVVSVPFHNLDTILGIPIWQWVGFQRVRGMTVMRVRPVVEAAGCAILPIAVRMNQFSLYPSNWTEGVSLSKITGDPVDLFPQGTKPPDG